MHYKLEKTKKEVALFLEVQQTELETLIDLYTLVNQTCTMCKSTANYSIC